MAPSRMRLENSAQPADTEFLRPTLPLWIKFPTTKLIRMLRPSAFWVGSMIRAITVAIFLLSFAGCTVAPPPTVTITQTATQTAAPTTTMVAKTFPTDYALAASEIPGSMRIQNSNNNPHRPFSSADRSYQQILVQGADSDDPQYHVSIFDFTTTTRASEAVEFAYTSGNGNKDECRFDATSSSSGTSSGRDLSGEDGRRAYLHGPVIITYGPGDNGNEAGWTALRDKLLAKTPDAIKACELNPNRQPAVSWSMDEVQDRWGVSQAPNNVAWGVFSLRADRIVYAALNIESSTTATRIDTANTRLDQGSFAGYTLAAGDYVEFCTPSASQGAVLTLTHVPSGAVSNHKTFASIAACPQ